jgi:hypothetical protein
MAATVRSCGRYVNAERQREGWSKVAREKGAGLKTRHYTKRKLVSGGGSFRTQFLSG